MRSKPEQKLLERLGKRVAKARANRHLTQEQLGEAIGMDAGSISRVERGRRWLSFEALVRLSQVLDVGLGTLLDLKTDLPMPKPHADTDLIEVIGRLTPERRELLLRLARELASTP